MMKSQSAMEYLMTYGWAILIIAVVLGAIYSLGLFNGATLAPRAQPGACEVLRPNGPGTTQYISLAGACTNELPQYVAQFNGGSSYISTGSFNLPLAASARSVFAWVYLAGTSLTTYYPIFSYGTHDASHLSELGLYGTVPYVAPGGNTHATISLPIDSWQFVGFTYAAGASTATVYIDGASQSISIGAFNTIIGAAPAAEIGQPVQNNPCCWFSGQIADVQVYNTSLDSNGVAALYHEGIGGAPIALQNLTGWWPLNGNANDYSGNLNNGQPTNVIYVNQWLNGYTVP